MKKSKHKNTDQDYLHVVEFSQGKPNEISFNVLGKKSSASAGPEKKGFWARLRRKNKGSYEGFGASMALGSGENPALKDALSRDTSSESGVSRETTTNAPSGKARGKHAQPAQKRFGRQTEEAPFLPNASGFSAEAYAEISRRQKQRSRSRLISILLVVLVIAVLATFAGLWLYQEYEKNRTNRELIEQACDYIEESDQTLVAIDEFFAQPFADDTISRAEQLQSQIPHALELLENAKKYAVRADEAIEGSTTDKEAVDIDAKKAMDDLALVEKSIDDAQYLLAQAATTVQQTSPETVAQSTEWLTEAQTTLQNAQTALNEAAELFPQGDFSLYGDYLAKRLEEINFGLLSNEAILIQDRKTAEKNNDLYNKADSASVELAQKFPETFAQPLVDAYAQASADLDNQLTQLRNDVGRYDSFLREYLGNETQES